MKLCVISFVAVLNLVANMAFACDGEGYETVSVVEVTLLNVVHQRAPHKKQACVATVNRMMNATVTHSEVLTIFPKTACVVGHTLRGRYVAHSCALVGQYGREFYTE